MFDDLVRYVAGVIPHSYPIAGSTALQYLRLWGLVSSPWAPVPTYLFELAVGLPTLFFASRALFRRPSPSAYLILSVLVVVSILLFSRFFLENYTAMLLPLLFGAYVLDRSKQSATE